MSASFKVVSFNSGTGAPGTAIDVDCGIPKADIKAIIFFWSGRTETSDTQGEATAIAGIGFGVSDTDRRAVCYRTAHGSGNAASDSTHSNAACVLSQSATAIDGALDLAAVANWPANGFRVVVDDTFPTSIRVHALVLAGSDITNAATGQYQGTNAASQDITSLGFQPDTLLVLRFPDSTAPPSKTDWAMPVVGIATGACAQAIMSGVSVDGGTNMDTASYTRAGEIGVTFTSATVNARDQDSLNSFLSNGFRLDRTNQSTDAYYNHFLALKGLNVAVGNSTTSTTNNGTVTISGLSFAPKAALFLSSGRAADAADTPSATLEWIVGAAADNGGITQACQSVLDKDAAATSDVGTAVAHTCVYQNQSTATTIVIEGRMRVTTFDSNGITLNMTDGTTQDGDPSAAFFAYLAFGQVGGAASPTLPQLERGTRGFARGMGRGQAASPDLW